MTAPCPLGLDELLAYLLGDLADRSDGEVDAIEEHLFDCAACGRRLDSLDALRHAVSEAARRAELGSSVGGAFVERAARDGLSVREYRIREGATVPCRAGPEDLVLVRLALGAERSAGLGEGAGLRLDATFEDLERRVAAELPPREVVVDRDRGEVMLVFPGAAVRSYPRSRWTMRLSGGTAAGEGPGEIGPFVLDHSPSGWDL